MKKVIDFLKEQFVMTLATSSDNKPRASALEYCMIGDALIFATGGESIKAKNMAKNKNVSISVNAMPRFVTLDGTTTQPDAAEIEKYNIELFQRHPEFKELVVKGVLHPFTYYKLVIETAYYNDYSNGMAPTEIIKA